MQRSNLRSGNPNASLNINRQGGRPGTMVLGMATVAAGLGAFWVFQFRQQNRSHSSSDPGEMPTWQFRHAQQVSEVNDRMAGTSRGKATPLRPAGQQPIQYKSTAPADSKDAVASNNGSSDTRRQSYTDRGVIGTIMTTLHGEPKENTHPEDGYVSQPAPINRRNDRGGIYTKNSDYKDGFRRD